MFQGSGVLLSLQVNEEEENMPVWKAALFKKRQNKISEEEEARLVSE